MTAALELHGISKRFGATEILHGIDLAIHRGERHALIGPNGAGKSTLFDLISGRTQPSGGRILLDGGDVTGWAAYRRSSKGLARSFQSTSVFAALCVRDNIRCAVLASPLATRKDRWLGSRTIDRETDRIVDAIGLGGRRDTKAATLSYAEQRALDLGLALASGASVLLLDEPTAGMNRAEAASALELIRETTKGKTLLMVEHDMQAVFALADRISVLVRGRVIATGTPEAIRSNAAVRTAYLGHES